MSQSSYDIKDPVIEELMKRIADTIADRMPPGWGFNLMLFEYGDGGSLFYISRAQRQDIIKVMQEFIARQSIVETSPPRRPQ